VTRKTTESTNAPISLKPFYASYKIEAHNRIESSMLYAQEDSITEPFELRQGKQHLQKRSDHLWMWTENIDMAKPTAEHALVKLDLDRRRAAAN